MSLYRERYCKYIQIKKMPSTNSPKDDWPIKTVNNGKEEIEEFQQMLSLLEIKKKKRKIKDGEQRERREEGKESEREHSN